MALGSLAACVNALCMQECRKCGGTHNQFRKTYFLHTSNLQNPVLPSKTPPCDTKEKKNTTKEFKCLLNKNKQTRLAFSE